MNCKIKYLLPQQTHLHNSEDQSSIQNSQIPWSSAADVVAGGQPCQRRAPSLSPLAALGIMRLHVCTCLETCPPSPRPSQTASSLPRLGLGVYTWSPGTRPTEAIWGHLGRRSWGPWYPEHVQEGGVARTRVDVCPSLHWEQKGMARRGPSCAGQGLACYCGLSPEKASMRNMSEGQEAAAPEARGVGGTTGRGGSRWRAIFR